MNARFDTVEEQIEAAEGFFTTGAEADEFAESVADAYSAAKDGIGDVTIAQALGTLAAAFYAPGIAMQENAESEWNALKFQQKGFLQSLTHNSKWMLENALEHRKRLEIQLDELEAVCDGGEIALNNLMRAADRYEECVKTQLPACMEWFTQTKIAYEAIIGEPWKPYAKKKDTAKATADAVRERLAKLRAGE